MTSRSLIASVLVGLALCVSLCANAQVADPAQTNKLLDENDPCKGPLQLTAPEVRWMGDFAYQATVTVKQGHVDAVDWQTIRGADDETNRVIKRALGEQIRAQFACAGDHVVVRYIGLHLKHEVPALAEQLALQKSRYTKFRKPGFPSPASSAASSAAAPDDDGPEGTMVCAAMGKPEMPRFNIGGTGTLILHAVVEVKAGEIGLVDVRMKVGSRDGGLNQIFIDTVTQAIRKTYKCAGTHVFEQEFHFRIS